MNNPTAAMLVIGDEILSGRTQDVNVSHVAKELTAHGIDLSEVRVVPDVIERISEAINELRVLYDHVFTSGGIGPTHDDITADAVAHAFKVNLPVNHEAKRLIEDRSRQQGLELNAARLRMARIPQGARLIQNSVSGAPGFSIGNVFVMAGVPLIFQAMLSTVLPELPAGRQRLSRTVEILCPEGGIANLLGEIARANANVSIGSYPFYVKGQLGSNVVIRGQNSAEVSQVEDQVRRAFKDFISG